jgi:hypothetical protein
MYTLDVSKIAATPVATLWDKLKGKFKVKFADGVVLETNAKQVIYSWYCWQINLRYNLPISSDHHVTSVIKNDVIRNNTHLLLLAKIAWSIYDDYAARGINDQESINNLFDGLSRAIYTTSSILYNELSTRCEEYVSGVDFADFAKMASDPDIRAKKAEYAKDTITSEDITGLYKYAMNIYNTKPEFKDNRLKLGIEIGSLSESQLMQCVVMRGKVFDISTLHFKDSIMESFTEGIVDLQSSMMESRSASISLFNTQDDLQNSEYMNRRHQLLTMVLQNLHIGDCGSTNHLKIYVTDKKYLDLVAGKYHIKDDGSVEVIRPQYTHLIGKTLKVRSVTAGCRHTDHYGVCSTCVGESSLTLPKGGGLGHSMVVITNEKISQLILSTKHYLASAVAAELLLSSDQVGYFKLDNSCYYLDTNIRSLKPVISIEHSNIWGLTDIHEATNVQSLNIKHVSKVPSIKMVLTTPEYSETIPFSLAQNNAVPCLSYEMLEYMRDTSNWVISDKDTIDIDMSKWDYKNRLFILPVKSASMSDYRKGIQAMYESNSKELDVRRNTTSPNEFLLEFFDKIIEKLDISLPIIDVVTYCSMIVDHEKNDYSLPKVHTGSSLSGLRDILSSRSASAQLAFQGHESYFTDTNTYLYPSNVSHPFDAMVMPEICNI